MKKLICLLLALVMLLSLVACAKKDEPAKPAEEPAKPAEEPAKPAEEPAKPAEEPAAPAEEQIELTFWGHQENSWNDSYLKVGEEFHKLNPNITINFEFFPYDEYEAKVLASLSSKGAGADLYELWGGWGVDFCSTGALAQMPDDMAKEVMDDAYPSTYGALEYEGHLYGLPLEFNIESGAMLVNLHLFEKAGLEIPTTWADMVEAAKQLKEGEGDTMAVKGLDFVGWDSVPYTFTAMILSQGDNYLNEDGSFNFTSEAAKKAFTELTNLVMVDGVTNLTGLTGGDDMENFQLLYADQVAMAPRGPWTIAEGVNTFELTYDKDFTYVAMPWYGDKVAFCNETGWSVAVNGSTAKQEAAFKFLNYLFSDDVLLSHNIACAQIPSKRSVAENPELLTSMPFLAPLIPILGNSQFIGFFNTDLFKEAINNTFTDYCTGAYGSVDEALEALEANCNDNLR